MGIGYLSHFSRMDRPIEPGLIDTSQIFSLILAYTMVLACTFTWICMVRYFSHILSFLTLSFLLLTVKKMHILALYNIIQFQSRNRVPRFDSFNSLKKFWTPLLKKKWNSVRFPTLPFSPPGSLVTDTLPVNEVITTITAVESIKPVPDLRRGVKGTSPSQACTLDDEAWFSRSPYVQSTSLHAPRSVASSRESINTDHPPFSPAPTPFPP